MKLKHIRHLVAISIATFFTYTPISHATPIGTDTLYYQGAVFTLSGDWTEDRYIITYLADFSGFEGGKEPSYLKAIDWNWEGRDISSVILKEAPGGTGQWLTQTSQQIDTVDSFGCKTDQNYDSGAVCTQFLGDTKGFATTTDLSKLRWVFEINFSYKFLRQTDGFLGDGLRAAFVNGSGTGKLITPMMSCSGAQNPGCPDERIELQTQAPSEDNGNVPIPGVPALLLAGLAGLFLSRRSGQGLRA